MSFQVADEIRVHIRWMVRRDLPEVLKIENESFEFPWTKDDFLGKPHQRNCIYMVAEYNENIVGFIVYELNKNKIKLINLAVDPRFRRLGVGTQMVAKLIGKLNYQNRKRITFEIRETNLGAQLFFRTIGFQVIQILKNYHYEMEEDAYLMQYRYIAEDHEQMATKVGNRINRLVG